jgi:hypothetical protein
VSVLSPAQVRQAAMAAGFTADQATIMTAIAGAESAYNTNAHNPKPPDNSYGLWQINMLGSMGPERRRLFGIGSNEALFDPATNARAAKAIFSQQGYRAWSTYSSGSYKKYLADAGKTAGGGGSGSGPLPTVGPDWAPWNWPADLGNAAYGAGQSARGAVDDAASSTAQTVLGGVGNIVMRGAFIVLGVTLIGVGIARGLSGYARGRVDQAAQAVL